MKVPEFLKKSVLHLAFFVSAALCVPYLAPLIQKGSSDAHHLSFWPPRIIFIAAGAVITLLLARWIRNRFWRLLAVLSFWGAFEFFIMLEAFMLCFVGHSFDQSFLMHCNADALSAEVMKAFWRPVTVVLLLYFAAMGFLGFLTARLHENKYRHRELLLLFIAVGLFFLPGTPLMILGNVIVENAQASANAPVSDDAVRKIEATPGKNLVFIVVESLEQNYLSEKHFPGLLPNVTKWMKHKDALVFENMVSSTLNTFDFLFQSHMGNYIYSITDSDNADRSPSLSLILKKAGYNTAFLKACSLDFASTETFVEKVQYERRMDWKTPEVKKQATELGEWGFRDYDLFKIAQGEFKKLAAQKKPFCFTLFTVDSHAPTGVLGKKSLSYTLPGGEKYPLLSALHTTDAALGKFLDFIANSPEGKNTVVVIAGDHLVMKDVVPGSKTVQAMLEYKKRENVVAFILNGADRGKVTEKCWPVDLAPVILHQMGVKHNALFPSGINPLTVKNAPPRKKLNYAEYIKMVRTQKAKKGGKTAPNALPETPVTVSGNPLAATMHIGEAKIKCDTLYEQCGSFMEFDSQTCVPTAYKVYLDRDAVKIFKTNLWNRDLFYMLCSNKRNLFHFVFGEYNWENCFLAAVRGGWYKVNSAKDIAQVKLEKINTDLPLLAESSLDVSKNVIRARKNGWDFPLFSKNNVLIPHCAVAGAFDMKGRETVMRFNFSNRDEMKNLNFLLRHKDRMTVIVPPDSPLHEKYNVPAPLRDQIMRLQIMPNGLKIETVSMRLPGEGFIKKAVDNKYYWQREGVAGETELRGAAPAKQFADNLYHTITFDSTGKFVSQHSFNNMAEAERIFLGTPDRELKVLICGKGSSFLKTYYPLLAKHNVLFAVSGRKIRHALQNSNGNFRIPDVNEPLDVLGGAGAVMTEKCLIINLGSASFAIPAEVTEKMLKTKHQVVLKVQHHDPAETALLESVDPRWLPDIAKAWKADFLILGTRNSTFPGLLQQKNNRQFFFALSRGFGWEFIYGDRINFTVAPRGFVHIK